jgi:hypothetical protein
MDPDKAAAILHIPEKVIEANLVPINLKPFIIIP